MSRTTVIRMVPVVLLALYAIVGLATLATFPVVWGDEAWYAEPAWSLIRNGTFALPMFADLAGSDVGTLISGRIHVAVTALAFAAGGPTPEAARFGSLLSAIIAIVALYGLGRELWSPRVGLIAAVLLAVAPVFVHQSHDARPEIMTMALALIAFYLMLVGERRGSMVLLVIAGLVAGLAADVHFVGVLAPVSLLVVLLVRRAPLRTIARFAVGLAIGAAWWLLVHVAPDPPLFFEQMRTFPPPSPQAMLQEPVVAIGLGLARFARVDMGSIVILVAAALAAYELLRRHPDLALRTVLAVLAVHVVFLTLLVSPVQPAYAVYIFPCLALLIARLLDVLDPARARVITAAVVGVALISVGHMGWRHRDADYPAYIARLQAAVPSDAVVLGDPSNWFGFHRQPYLAVPYFNHAGPFADEVERLGIEYVIADELMLEFQLAVASGLTASDVNEFLAEEAELVAVVEDNHYGRYQSGGERPYVTRVYRLDKPGPSDQP